MNGEYDHDHAAFIPCMIGTRETKARVHVADRIDTRNVIRIKERALDDWSNVRVTGIAAEKGRITYFTAEI